MVDRFLGFLLEKLWKSFKALDQIDHWRAWASAGFLILLFRSWRSVPMSWEVLLLLLLFRFRFKFKFEGLICAKFEELELIWLEILLKIDVWFVLFWGKEWVLVLFDKWPFSAKLFETCNDMVLPLLLLLLLLICPWATCWLFDRVKLNPTESINIEACVFPWLTKLPIDCVCESEPDFCRFLWLFIVLIDAWWLLLRWWPFTETKSSSSVGVSTAKEVYNRSFSVLDEDLKKPKKPELVLLVLDMMSALSSLGWLKRLLFLWKINF